jgi:hypothetical protein
VKYILLVLALLAIGVAASASPRPTLATSHWAPLLNCPDVNANSGVDIGDVFAVAGHFGAFYNGTNYQLLYDVTGDDASITIEDIFYTGSQFGQICPLIETQVAQAALATNQYEDCQDAVADGYTPGTGGAYVPQMGIHISKLSVLENTFDPSVVFGLVCTETYPGSSVVDKLIGLWYLLPVEETCAVYVFVQGPCHDSNVMPVGFGDSANDEDNQDPPGPQSGWHTHINLCVGPGFLDELGPAPNTSWHDENDPEHECLVHRGGTLLIPVYGWMVHLYTMIPNPDGRFMLWNTNAP